LLYLTLLFLRDNENTVAALTDWSDHTAACKMPAVPQLSVKEMIRKIEETPGSSQNLKTGARKMPGGPGPCKKYPECPFMGQMPELVKIDI
jgi:hypothetical protein